MTDGQKDLARSLQAVDAIKLRQDGEPGFKLKIHQTNPDAPLSPIFISLRTPDNKTHGEGTLTPEIVTRIGEELYELIERDGIAFDHIAGIPNAGVPPADALVAHSAKQGKQISQLTLHKEGDLNTRRITEQVDGDFQEGDTVLLIDDLITHAKTKHEAIDAVRGAGLKVTDLAVLVDREQGGPAEMAKTGVTAHAVFTMSQMLDLYRAEDTISQAIYDEIKDYMAQ